MKRKLSQKLLLILFFFIGCVCMDVYAIRIDTGVDWVTADLNGRDLEFTVTDESGFSECRFSFDNTNFKHYIFSIGEKSFTYRSLIPDGNDVVLYVVKRDMQGVEHYATFKVLSRPLPPTPPTPPNPPPKPAPVLHTITVPPVEGITTYPGSGTHLVEKGTDMTLLVFLPDDYDQSDVKLLANGDTIYSEESKLNALAYTFLIPVTTDTEIEVVGVERNNSVNTTPQPPEGGAKVWTSPGCIHVSQEAVSNKQHGVRIYTMMGRLVFHSQLSTVNCQLPSGAYIVVVGDQVVKVMVSD